LASNIFVEAHYRKLKLKSESDLKDAHLKPGRNVLSVEELRHTKYCHMIDDTTAYQVHTCNEVFSLLHFFICAHLFLVDADHISNSGVMLRRLTDQHFKFQILVMKC
jgi:hypothetical protein